MAGIRDSIAVKNSLVGTLYTDNAMNGTVGTAYNPTYALVNEAGAQIVLFINSADYKMYAQLKDKYGNLIYTSNIIDLPLESVVMNGRYDSTTKEIILTLVNGNEIRFSVEDLVRGLVDEDQLEEVLGGYWSKQDLTEEDIENWNNKQDYLNQGENIQIYSDLSLKGQIQQDSTTGKNYLPITLLETSVLNGVTVKYDSESGYITINGTATAITNFVWNFDDVLLPATTYVQYENDFSNASVQVLYFTGNTQIGGLTFSGVNRIYDLSGSLGNKTLNRCSLYIANGTTINGKFRPMITQYSTQQDYEPYTNGASPNPDYPQDIHIVSGDNTINIYSGNNLFNNHTASASGEYLTETGEVATGSSNLEYTTNYIEIPKNGTKLYVSGIYSSFSAPALCFYDDNKNFIRGESYLNRSEVFFDIPSNAKYFRTSYRTNYSDFKVVVSQTQLISLGVENLWKNQTTGWLATSGSYPTTNTSYPNAKYILVDLKEGQSITLSIETATTLGRVRYIDKSTNQIVGSITTATNNYYTSTASFDGSFTNGTITAKQDFIVGIMDMGGSVNDLVVNYGKSAQYISNSPMELYKIGTYQDYIYKDNNRWYLHKEIGKVVLNGSETLEFDSNNLIYKEDNIRNYNAGGLVYCNYYLGTANGGSSNVNLNAWNGNAHNINIKNNSIANLNDFKTWLSTHNTIVYYVLATPENILLNDKLQETLNGLSANLSDKEMINIIQDNNDLPFIINYDNTKLTINVPCAGADQGGVIKTSDSYATATADGVLTSQTKTYAQYNSLNNNAFVSKGTLENVLNKYIGDIDTALDAINGEVI